MAFDINNFVIDRVIRGVMVDGQGSYMWSINQITDPSLNITSETADAVDALGSVIARFNRSKSAEFTANNSLFDLGLYAAQNGVDKLIADAGNKLVAPAFEEIALAQNVATTSALAHTPKGTIAEIFVLNGDGTLGTKLVSGTAASATEFVYNTSDNTITVDSSLTTSAGVTLFVQYEYETEAAVEVIGDAVNFPKAGKFVMEILGADVCDQSKLIHAYLVFPNAKLDANVDISFTTDGNHPLMWAA